MIYCKQCDENVVGQHPCPKCGCGEAVSYLARPSDDQPQKPFDQCCDNGNIGIPHDCQKSKPDATAREWSILCVGDIADGSDKIVVTEGPWNSNDGSIKVIEKSAYDALKARVAELEAKPILGVSHFYEGALIEKNARIAELEAEVEALKGTYDNVKIKYVRTEEREQKLVAALEWIAVGHKGGPKIGSECQRKAQEALKAHKGGG